MTDNSDRRDDLKSEDEISNVDLQFMGQTDEKRELDAAVRAESRVARDAEHMSKIDVMSAQSMDASDPPSTNMGDAERDVTAGIAAAPSSSRSNFGTHSRSALRVWNATRLPIFSGSRVSGTAVPSFLDRRPSVHDDCGTPIVNRAFPPRDPSQLRFVVPRPFD